MPVSRDTLTALTTLTPSPFGKPVPCGPQRVSAEGLNICMFLIEIRSIFIKAMNTLNFHKLACY